MGWWTRWDGEVRYLEHLDGPPPAPSAWSLADARRRRRRWRWVKRLVGR